MGQKVHPLGFRVGITKKHQSQWFARFHKSNYSQSVLEDRMLRNTLMRLVSQVPLGAESSNLEKRKDEKTTTPKITQIKIERGLIPYELGIQIHAENCELIKSAIDKLKIDRDLACYLEKARKFLVYLGQQPTTAKASSSESLENVSYKLHGNLEKSLGGSNLLALDKLKKTKTLKRVRKVKNTLRTKDRFALKFGNKKRGQKLTKQAFRRKKLIQKRLKKRLNIRSRYQKFITKGLFLTKTSTQNNKSLSSQLQSTTKTRGLIVRKIQSTKNNKFKTQLKKSFKKTNTLTNFKEQSKVNWSSARSNLVKNNTTKLFLDKQNKKSLVVTRIKRKIQKKLVTLYLNKMNKNFLIHLKRKIQSWISNPNTTPTTSINFSSNVYTSNSVKPKLEFAPFGYSQDWNLKKIKALKNSTLTFKQPLTKLIKLAQILETKSLKKLNALRKYFITFGTLSNTQTYSYYQIIIFLKNLTQLIRKRLTRLATKVKAKGFEKNTAFLSKSQIKSTTKTNNVLLRASTTKLSKNIDDECRKIKFIEYLKQIVKKHRTENIFYYLSTLSKAKKDLKQIKKFTLKNAQFLFGDLETINTERFHEGVKDILIKNTTSVDKTLQNSFIQQIEKQRLISKENLKLTPKISIKFYSVNPRSLELKASVVAYSIVDALEQRKAFRGVIKKTKEELMKKPTVKGIKIQVSGRLNGAEIARTEWVRAGRVPLQTLRANIDYSYRTANTIYGIIGVKVWIFKGYAKNI